MALHLDYSNINYSDFLLAIITKDIIEKNEFQSSFAKFLRKDHMSVNKPQSEISRRTFIKGLGGGIVGTAAVGSAITGGAAPETGPEGAEIRGPDKVQIALTVNGKKHRLLVEPRTTLLDAIRDQLGYTGSKRVCNRGECGACTVILSGNTILACSMLALDADGGKIETVEGLAKGSKLSPVQEAFVKHDAMQCGFCTSGFVVSSTALLRENPQPTLEEIKMGVSGNLCRCGTYPHIFAAVTEAAESMRKGG